MSSPPKPPARSEQKYTDLPSRENAGSKSREGELKLTGCAALHVPWARREIQMSYPPGPPGRLRLNHSAVFPSALIVSRISEWAVDTMPGTNASGVPTTSKDVFTEPPGTAQLAVNTAAMSAAALRDIKM